MEDERLISNAAFDQNDVQTELSLRPQKTVAQYIGQKKRLSKSSDLYIEAAKNRQESLDHVPCSMDHWGWPFNNFCSCDLIG